MGCFLDVYLVRPENSLVSCNTVLGIGNHCGALLEDEWSEMYSASQSGKIGAGVSENRRSRFAKFPPG